MRTVTRKADRASMAAELADIGREYTADVIVRQDEGEGARRTIVALTLGSALIGVSFDGNSTQPDVFCPCWNVVTGSTARFSGYFAVQTGGSLNPYHKQKVQCVYQGFAELRAGIRAGLATILDGNAWEPGSLGEQLSIPPVSHEQARAPALPPVSHEWFSASDCASLTASKSRMRFEEEKSSS